MIFLTGFGKPAPAAGQPLQEEIPGRTLRGYWDSKLFWTHGGNIIHAWIFTRQNQDKFAMQPMAKIPQGSASFGSGKTFWQRDFSCRCVNGLASKYRAFPYRRNANPQRTIRRCTNCILAATCLKLSSCKQ
jgi:hypothetical protein